MRASIAFDFESPTAMGSNFDRDFFGHPTSLRNIAGCTEDLETEIMHEKAPDVYIVSLLESEQNRMRDVYNNILTTITTISMQTLV